MHDGSDLFLFTLSTDTQAKVAHKRSGKKDLYATLGIVQGASDDEIKKVRCTGSFNAYAAVLFCLYLYCTQCSERTVLVTIHRLCNHGSMTALGVSQLKSHWI